KNAKGKLWVYSETAPQKIKERAKSIVKSPKHKDYVFTGEIKEIEFFKGLHSEHGLESAHILLDCGSIKPIIGIAWKNLHSFKVGDFIRCEGGLTITNFEVVNK
ncbi:MAG: hypothetical protein AAB558_04720, partial [Patescibacteria group bacterium]